MIGFACIGVIRNRFFVTHYIHDEYAGLLVMKSQKYGGIKRQQILQIEQSA